MSRVSVEWLTLGTLLVALYGHDANTPAQDRSQLGVAELLNGAVVIDRRVDYLNGLAFEAIGDLLKRPALPVLDRALDELFGQLVDLLALLLVIRIDSIQFEAQRVGEYLLRSCRITYQDPGLPLRPGSSCSRETHDIDRMQLFRRGEQLYTDAVGG
jgi:hypothetical protein